MWLLRIALFIGLVGVLALAADESDYEYEDAPEPVAPKKPTIIPNRGIRPGLSIPAGKNNKIPATPVKAPGRKGSAPAPPAPEPEAAPEEYDEEEEGAAEAPAEESSTEPPKKTIKPVVRPFRSNDDLLAALKRRRQQAQEKGTVVDRTTQSPLFSTEAPKKQTINVNKNRRPKPIDSNYAESVNRRPPSSGRKPPGRGAKQIEEEQPEVEATVPPASKTNKFSRGSRRQ